MINESSFQINFSHQTKVQYGNALTLLSPLLERGIFFIDEAVPIDLRPLKKISINHPEKNLKNLSGFQQMLQEIERFHPEKNDPFVAIGGGALLDSVGLMASIYQRGHPLIYVPSTLLSMVDSAIGGKTALNFEGSKNILGTFYPASKVIIDVELLTSLQKKEWSSGFVELLKNLCITNHEILNKIFDGQSHIEELDIASLIKASIEAKMTIVTKDPTDQHIRKVLNWGHSLGHAIESASNHQINHGNAVCAGILTSLTFQSPDFPNKETVINLFLHLLDKNILQLEPRDLLVHMEKDKKLNHQLIDEPILRSLGNMEIVKMSPSDILHDYSNFLRWFRDQA